jgi:hypothetical protein
VHRWPRRNYMEEPTRGTEAHDADSQMG